MYPKGSKDSNHRVLGPKYNYSILALQPYDMSPWTFRVPYYLDCVKVRDRNLMILGILTL